MRRTTSITFLMTITIGTALALSAGGCAVEAETATNATALSKRNNEHVEWWRGERAAREAALQSYLTVNAGEWASYKNAPVSFSGVPVIMLKVLPLMYPAIWGDEHLSKAGFVKDPYEPARTLPLGLGAAPTIPLSATFSMQTATLTCAGCHMGRVEMGDGSVRHVIGGPSTTFSGFRGYLEQSIAQSTWTVADFRAAISGVLADPTRGLKWFYGSDPASLGRASAEVNAFLYHPTLAGQLVGLIKARVAGRRALIDASLGKYTYGLLATNPPDLNAATPGFLDAIGVGMTAIPGIATTAEGIAGLPRAPAMIDMMSVWRQDDRSIAQWDGSIDSALHRNLAAELGVAGAATGLNFDNAVKTTHFTGGLPSTPYPFDIDEKAAKRGERLYGEYCASCHINNSRKVFTDAGTDSNRANMWSPFTRTGLISLLRTACPTTNTTCATVTDPEIITITGGYTAPPLDGIWARAPYLHNGSVPTIEALLTNVRPTTFYRGNIAYDEAGLGFVSDDPTKGVLFDTRKDGMSNAGHSTAAFNGDIDWTKGNHLEDLIAYLKTL